MYLTEICESCTKSNEAKRGKNKEISKKTNKIKATKKPNQMMYYNEKDEVYEN